jgi:hypothetical protein
VPTLCYLGLHDSLLTLRQLVGYECDSITTLCILLSFPPHFRPYFRPHFRTTLPQYPSALPFRTTLPHYPSALPKSELLGSWGSSRLAPTMLASSRARCHFPKTARAISSTPPTPRSERTAPRSRWGPPISSRTLACRSALLVGAAPFQPVVTLSTGWFG